MRLVLGLCLLLDVFPHCGGTTVVIREAGEDCGPHGPRWRGDCRAPLTCWYAVTGGSLCSVPCADDAACAPLGPGFKCGLQASGSAGAQTICSKPEAPAR